MFLRVFRGIMNNKSLPMDKPEEITSLIYLVVAEFSKSVVEQLKAANALDITIETESKQVRRHDKEKTMLV